MTLLELYEKICTGEIQMVDCLGDPSGLCVIIADNGYDWKEFQDVTCRTIGKEGQRFYNSTSQYISKPGVMTPERETFLLLFAAYKGEL